MGVVMGISCVSVLCDNINILFCVHKNAIVSLHTTSSEGTRRPIQNSSVLPGCLQGLGHQVSIFLKANKTKSVLLYEYMHKVPACFFEMKFLFQLSFALID